MKWEAGAAAAGVAGCKAEAAPAAGAAVVAGCNGELPATLPRIEAVLCCERNMLMELLMAARRDVVSLNWVHLRLSEAAPVLKELKPGLEAAVAAKADGLA